MMRQIKENMDAGSGILESVWIAIWGDATPADRMRFFRIMFRFLVAFHIAWACGFLQPVGLIGFAWVSDIKEAVEHTEKAHAELLAPVNKRLDEISKQLTETQTLSRKLFIGQLSSQLRDLNRIRCMTTDHVTRYRLESDIEEAQSNYRLMTGERYPLTPCKDLQ